MSAEITIGDGVQVFRADTDDTACPFVAQGTDGIIRLKEIHGVCSDEGGYIGVGWAFIEFTRMSGLRDPSCDHDNNLVCHRHCFCLVMGHIDKRARRALVQSDKLCTHFESQPGIKVRQRFVQQKENRIPDQGTSQRNALLLPAGQRSRFLMQNRAEAEAFGSCVNLSVNVRTGLCLPGDESTETGNASQFAQVAHRERQGNILENA